MPLLPRPHAGGRSRYEQNAEPITPKLVALRTATIELPEHYRSSNYKDYGETYERNKDIIL